MLAHGADEIVALAARCLIEQQHDVNGWHVDIWTMDDEDVDAAIAVYAAVLSGGATDPVLALLAEDGLDLNTYLYDEDQGKGDITRADVTELTAAASIVADPGCDIDLMHMPNVPKMSRRKSDSGFDIAIVNLKDQANADDLEVGERLDVVSVKHTIDSSAGGMRWKLVDSLSDRELSHAYITTQLRVLNGRLRQEGRTKESAARIYYFLRGFPNSPSVGLFAVGVADPGLRDDLAHHVDLLPDAGNSERTFRMILLPGLRTLQDRCP